MATARNACASASASGRMDFETETFLVAPVATAIRTANTSANGHGISDELAHTLDGAQGQCVAFDTAHTLRGEGFDASEDGTGRGTPLVPVHCRAVAQTLTSNYGKQVDNSDTALGPNIVAFDTTQITSAANRSNPQPGDACHPLAAGAHAPAIAFAIQAGALRTNPESGPDGMGVQAGHAYTLEARAEVQAVAYTTKLHNTASNQAGKFYEEYATALDRSSPPPAVIAPAMAFQSSQSGVRIGDTHATLDAHNGPRRHNGALVGMQVRRLTPTEAERLQGFPDGYTAIPWRGKPADQCPDGPRYRALGNSWAVPNVTWIGRRIQSALRNS